jgi:hypothetical protein
MQQHRLRLVLGKFPVVSVTKNPHLPGFTIKVKMDNVTMMFALPTDRADIRPNDLLTLYTEVLLKESADANSLPPPE